MNGTSIFQLVIASTLLIACGYDASFRDCEVHCASDGTCPNDLACDVNGLCRTLGATTTCSEQLLDARVDATTSDALLPMPPSCIELPATCGPTSSSPCCDSPLVPGGMFDRDYDVASDAMFPNTSFPATVSAFRLDAYEVTVGRFRAFVNAGMGTQSNPPPAGSGARVLNGLQNQAGWDPNWNEDLAADAVALGSALHCDATHATWTAVASTNEDLPVNCVTWFEAFAFCTWDEGSLPTDAEWNFAASGGNEQRAYAWSNPPNATSIDCTHANYAAAYPTTSCVGDPARVGATSPDGDGRWGHSDLAGNVDEWVLDAFTSALPVPCEDCAVLGSGSDQVLRGGDWANDGVSQRGASRNHTVGVGNRDPKIGIRCRH